MPRRPPQLEGVCEPSLPHFVSSADNQSRCPLGTARILCDTYPLTVEHHDKGTEIAERYRFSFYDSVIIASALLAGCKTLYSEDLQHKRIIDKQLTVINLFAKARG